ncbi:uncharacterized protein LOC130109943 [Lampris incognitus]|uniref:uncharacterized protein LOC130109943 n=1 Tax=Lampris incognitus TaxID=2546036 RepID=UPI0024B53862|nr:uncharacterized protein LOC130109943 [Lampris incognitus]
MEKYSPGLSESSKRAIRKAAKNYSPQGEDLFYQGADGPLRRIVFTEEKKMAILEEAHAGHFGRDRMMEKIRKRFYWHSITADVDDWVSTCEQCQKFEKVKTESPELKPIKPVAPWHMIGVDLIGPLKASQKGGNTYLLTATDYFTKWVEARPILAKQAELTSASSTKYSPFRLMYGREPRLFSEIAGDGPAADDPVAEVEDEDIEAFVHGRAEADADVFDKVRQNIEKAQERQKAAYLRRKKKNTKRFDFIPGTEVLKKNERKRGRPGMTMQPDWPTKYRVIGVEDNLVQLETMDGKPLSTKL